MPTLPPVYPDRYLEPHQARLDHHDVAIRDITTALQQLQAWIPQDIGERLRVHDDVVREVEEVMPQLLNTITSAHGQQRAAARQIADLKPDGVFLSNGPGDPATADAMVAVTREVLGAGIPLFGICFGNQILGRALGRSTYKMTFGHRGINIPVMDHATGRVAITAQNHGFALEGEAGEEFDTPFGRAVVSHTCANDGVVEGIRLIDGRAFSVQYHPEAAAGPHDAEYLFDQFVDLMGGAK